MVSDAVDVRKVGSGVRGPGSGELGAQAGGEGGAVAPRRQLGTLPRNQRVSGLLYQEPWTAWLRSVRIEQYPDRNRPRL